MSGLSHTPGKRTKGKTFRGFESRPLRQRTPYYLGFLVFLKSFPPSVPPINLRLNAGKLAQQKVAFRLLLHAVVTMVHGHNLSYCLGIGINTTPVICKRPRHLRRAATL
jgi:hypothetical protein